MQNIPKARVKSVKKALDLLTSLVFDDLQRRGQALSALAEKHGLPGNTAHSLLQTLTVCGYACRTDAGLYAAGDVTRQIGVMNRIHGAWAVNTLLPAMKKFSQSLEAAAVFTVLGAGKRIVAARTESGGVIRVDLSAVEEKAFYSLPTSRALTAWASEEQLAQIVEANGLPGDLWGGAKTPEDLKTLAARLRDVGYVSIENADNGTYACVAPLLRKDGSLIGAMGTYTPLYGFGPKKKKQLIQGLLGLTKRIQEP